MQKRRLGRSGIEVSAIGLGCWAIGGTLWRADGDTRTSLSWGQVDDQESIRAIHRALDLGVNFFDTADAYGCGQSERLLGQAVADRRDKVVIATKFGGIFDKETRDWLGDADEETLTPNFIREACEASLKRLDTDYIDLYQFHIAYFDAEKAIVVRETLEELVKEGKIRCYGWSTNDPDRARVFAEGTNCAATQYHYNILQRSDTMLAFCKEHHLASIARGPLAMGVLTGKFTPDTQLPEDDVRHGWDFKQGYDAKTLEMVEAIREVMTQGGHSMTQAALGWLLARGDQVIPIPGFKNVKQAEENAGTLQLGPLSEAQTQEIDRILDDVHGLEKLDLDYIISSS